MFCLEDWFWCSFYRKNAWMLGLALACYFSHWHRQNICLRNRVFLYKIYFMVASFDIRTSTLSCLLYWIVLVWWLFAFVAIYFCSHNKTDMTKTSNIQDQLTQHIQLWNHLHLLNRLRMHFILAIYSQYKWNDRIQLWKSNVIYKLYAVVSNWWLNIVWLQCWCEI